MLHRNFAYGKKNSLLLLSCRTSGNCYAQCHFCLWMWDIHVMSAPAQPEESLIMRVYDLNFCITYCYDWWDLLELVCLFGPDLPLENCCLYRVEKNSCRGEAGKTYIHYVSYYRQKESKEEKRHVDKDKVIFQLCDRRWNCDYAITCHCGPVSTHVANVHVYNLQSWNCLKSCHI